MKVENNTFNQLLLHSLLLALISLLGRVRSRKQSASYHVKHRARLQINRPFFQNVDARRKTRDII